MRPNRMVLALLAILALMAGDVAAQQRGAARGWLGFSYNVGGQDAERRAIIRVADVVDDSPAERAGLQRGDTLVAVNGLAASEPLLSSLAWSLAPGDEVTLRIRRGGRERDLTATAAARPATYAITTPGAYYYSFDADSLRDRMLLFRDSLIVHLDSMRVPMMRLERLLGDSAQWRVFGDSAQWRLFGDSARWRVFSDSLVRFQGRLQDSLRVHWDSIARQSARRAQREAQRLRLQLDTLRNVELRSLDSLRLRGLRSLDSLDLRGHIRIGPRDGWFYVWGGDSTFVMRGDSAWPGAEAFNMTVLSAFGGRAIAGAELSELHEGLDAYFGVDDGVLVMRVPEGTPAARAGLRPGDVIVRADDRDVGSIEELRRAFLTVRRGDDLRLEVIRRNRPVSLELKRD